MSWTWVAKALPPVARLCRKARLGRLVVEVRNGTTLGIVAPFHFQVVHKMQQLLATMTARLPDGEEAATQVAIGICTEGRELMGRALELDAHDLHCCLKVMAKGRNAGAPDRVATWVRSEPIDDRPVEQGEENAHEVETNTVWASLMGVSDGKRLWRPFLCFACNDLVAAGSSFQCDRQGWR